MQSKSKRLPCILIFCVLVILLFLTSCQKTSDESTEVTFTGSVVSLNEDTLLLRPDDDTPEDQIATQFYVPIDTQIYNKNGDKLGLQELAKASRVQVVYDGVLDGSDPALVKHCYRIIVLE